MSQPSLSIQHLFSQNKRQLEAWNAQCDKRFLLYGGAAGGGKSFFLRWWAVGYLMSLAKAGIKGASVGVFCEDYPSLYDRQISKIKSEFPNSLGKLRQGDTREFVLNDKFGGGRILLRNLDDPSKYLSSEFAGIGVDELTRNLKETFDFLRLRLRWPGVAAPRFVGTTNPGQKGHAWVRALWIDHEFPPELQPLASEFVFVPAKAEDNPFLSTSYWEELSTLPPDMARAYREGSWDIFAGQYFDIFKAEHNVKPAHEIKIESWWPKWVSIDWGFKHLSAVYWHTTTPDGKHITYREFVQDRLSPRMLGMAIAERSVNEHYQAVYLSPDAFAERTGESTIAQQLNEVLLTTLGMSCGMAGNDRVGGWMLMYELLRSGGWSISSACPKLIANLPTLTRNAKKPEDVLKTDGDDPADAARYGIYSHLRAARPPLNDWVDARISATDPTSIMIWRGKFEQEERRKMSPVFRPMHNRFRQQYLN